MDIGYTMLCEQTPPKQLVSDLVRAEEIGFGFSVISDHYFPWLEDQGHSPYEAERRAATHRLLDHYLHTAYPAAMLLDPTREPVTPPQLQRGVGPERLADKTQALAWFEAERRALMAAATQALEAGFDIRAWQIPWALSGFLDLRGHWHDWAGTEQTALAAAQRLGERAGRQAGVERRLGYARARLGAYEDAHAHLRHALGIYPQLEAATGDSLGYARHHLGDHGESAACYRRALDLYREIGDRWGQAVTLGHIGDARHAAGCAQEARAAWEEALAILDDLRHPDAGQIRAKLAGLGTAPRT